MKALNAKLTLLTITCILVGAANADAQVKPFKVTGGGIAEYVPLPGDDPALHFAVGNATHLGNYYGDGAVFADAFTGLTTASFFSAVPFIFTAANGDNLAFHYGRVDFGAEMAGEVELFPAEGGKFVAVWTAEFNPVPEECTGRFEDVVAGSFIMIATTEPFVLGAKVPVAYTWEGDGWIEFDK